MQSPVKGKSVWEWPAGVPELNFAREEQPHTPRKLGMMECWNYADSQSESAIIVDEATDDDVYDWLHRQPPLSQGLLVSIGRLKVVHIVQPENDTIPLRKPTFRAIQNMFRLPPVESHWSSGRSGACGMFLDDAGNYGK